MRLRFGDFILDTDRHELTRDGNAVRLPKKTFQLLQILAEERPKAVAQQDLYDRLWPETFVAKSNLHNLIYQLREALGDRDQTIVRTVYGFGFSFAAPVSEAATMARWQIVVGDREFDLHDGDNLVGREREATVRIDSTSISRQHARITVSPRGVTIVDLDSKNGTTVRGHRVRSMDGLRDGDRIIFGTVAAVLREVRPANTTQTAAT
jgi:DNA-binding winged helix-turn-helix (wHTH) protein